jgi:hypothetical protein
LRDISKAVGDWKLFASAAASTGYSQLGTCRQHIERRMAQKWVRSIEEIFFDRSRVAGRRMGIL